MPSESLVGHLEWLTTQDGSRTLRDLQLDVTYRSSHGAKTESQHVFVQPVAGLRNPLRVFEFGFGLGTNFLELKATHNGALIYRAVERSPLPPELWNEFNDSADEQLSRLGEAFLNADDESCVLKSLDLDLEVRFQDFVEVEFEEEFDAIFHDPFGPSANPGAWTKEIFEREFRSLASHGVLLTYSSAGHVRRALEEAGFEVVKRPGPGRKREVIAALKSDAAKELWAL